MKQEWLKALVCPLTKTALEYHAERHELVSRAANLAYPIKDGIPVLLVEEAREWVADEVTESAL